MSQPVCDKNLFFTNSVDSEQNGQTFSAFFSRPLERVKNIRYRFISSLIYNFLKNISHNSANSVKSNSVENGVDEEHHSFVSASNGIPDTFYSQMNPEYAAKLQSVLIEYIKSIHPSLELLNGFDHESIDKLPKHNHEMNFKLLESIMNINNQSIIGSDNYCSNQNLTATDLNFHTQNGVPTSVLVNLHDNMKITCMSLVFDEYIWTSEMLGNAYPSKYFTTSNTKIFNIIEEVPWMNQNQAEVKEVRKGYPMSHQHGGDSFNSSLNIPKVKRTMFSSPPPQLSISCHAKIENAKLDRPKRKQRASTIQPEISSSSFIPHSTLGSSRIELIKYSEIITPNWRVFEPSGNLQSSNGDTSYEDTSDHVYFQRHSKFEKDEHNKYMLALKTGRRHKRRFSVNANNKPTKIGKANQEINANASNITLYNEDCVSQLFS